MKTKIKSHARVTVTARDLRRFDACDLGIRCVRKLLPMTLSTNPEDNIKVARALHDIDQGHRAWWFRAALDDWNVCYGTCCDETMRDARDVGEVVDHENDVYVVAQVLAWAADKIAAKEGR